MLFGWGLLAEFAGEVILMAKDATADAEDAASFMAALETRAKLLRTREIRSAMATFGAAAAAAGGEERGGS